jgi:hypothetical protein
VPADIFISLQLSSLSLAQPMNDCVRNLLVAPDLDIAPEKEKKSTLLSVCCVPPWREEIEKQGVLMSVTHFIIIWSCLE